MTVQILTGDCRDVLRTMPAESVHCCVTSPPYFGLRDYDVDRQMGLERTPEEFIAGMVAVFEEVRRVLRKDGTLWLNIGDSYAGSRCGAPTGSSLQGSRNSQDEAKRAKLVTRSRRRDDAEIPRSDMRIAGIKNKELIGIPWMLAFALRSAGWYLRQDIIWHKPNPMPESCRDRCTKAHEYVFLLTKAARYYYDAEAIKEPAITQNEVKYSGDGNGLHSGESHAGSGKSTRRYGKGVAGWETGPGDHSVVGHNQPGRKSHAATVKKNNGVGWGYADGDAAKPRTTHAETLSDNLRKRDGMGGQEWAEREFPTMRNKRSVWTVPTSPYKEAHFATFPPNLIVPCIQAGCPVDGTVLDPFGGAGTTGLVADRLQRHAVLIELNPKYAAMAERRIRAAAPLFADVQAASSTSGNTTTDCGSSSSAGSPATSSRSEP